MSLCFTGNAVNILIEIKCVPRELYPQYRYIHSVQIGKTCDMSDMATSHVCYNA